MRSYPRNTPLAAARIVALTMLCDGHLSKAEIDAFELHPSTQRLGLLPGQWQAVMKEVCEDMLCGAQFCWSGSCTIDAHALAGVLSEVDHAPMRVDVLRICAAVVDADGHLSDGETLVMNAAVEQWGLQHEMFMLQPNSRQLAAA